MMAFPRIEMFSFALIGGSILIASRWKFSSVRKKRKEKPVIAVDLDEVLGGFVPAFLRFLNEKHGSNWKESDFFSYRFSQVLGCSDAEAVKLVFEFFKTRHFLEDLRPIPDAFEVLSKHCSRFSFHVVTSRQREIEEETLEWLETYYAGIFDGIDFGNHWMKEAPHPDFIHHSKKSKPEMCGAIGAKLLIDDSVSYCQKCAANGIECVLFGNYAWNQTSKLPANVKRCLTWIEVDEILSVL